MQAGAADDLDDIVNKFSAFLKSGHLITHLNIETELTNPINSTSTWPHICLEIVCKFWWKKIQYTYMTVNVNNMMFMKTLNNERSLIKWSCIRWTRQIKHHFSLVFYIGDIRVISVVLKENLSRCELLWQLIARLI